jgi:hypothetical protein
MKAYVGVDVEIHVFLTSPLIGGERSASRPCRFNPNPIGKSPWPGGSKRCEEKKNVALSRIEPRFHKFQIN